MTDDTERVSIVIDAELGSSLLNITITNADAAQLFAAASILEANARVALAGQMAHAAAQNAPTLDIVRGGLPSARN